MGFSLHDINIVNVSSLDKEFSRQMPNIRDTLHRYCFKAVGAFPKLYSMIEYIRYSMILSHTNRCAM